MFTVVIPYYNKAKYIQRCLHSVWNQTFEAYEIILVNDGSTDNGLQFLAERKLENLTLIHQENKGVSEARNTGIKKAKNQYIAFLDADDCWHSDYLEKIKQVIDIESDIKIIGANYSRNNDYLSSKLEDLDYYKFDDYFKVAIRNTYFTSSSTVIKSEFFNQNDGFNPNLKSGEDTDVWFRAVQSGGNAFYIKNKLVYYSDEDENQATKNQLPLQNSLVGTINTLYENLLKSSKNKSFNTFVSKYVYFNLYPHYFDKQYAKEAKIILNQNQHSYFFLRLPYIVPFPIGNKTIRNYLKFITRYIYN